MSVRLASGLTHVSPLFSFTGVDYMGHLYLKNAR